MKVWQRICFASSVEEGPVTAYLTILAVVWPQFVAALVLAHEHKLHVDDGLWTHT